MQVPTKPVLITFTSPTCSGKSYLLSYIRDVAKLPCFVSTTTRPMREGEVDGVDYYFISDEESRAIEARDGFAELMTFRGYRYGVSKEEFKKKLDMGMAFLVVEPEGIEHYAKPALEVGALWIKYFVDVPQEVRIERFKKRMEADVMKAVQKMQLQESSSLGGDYSDTVKSVVRNYLSRFESMLGPETRWKNMHQWDDILDGQADPRVNLNIINMDVAKVRVHDAIYGPQIDVGL